MVVPHDTAVLGVAWSDDGRWVAAAGGGRTPGAPGAVRVTEPASGRTLDCHGHTAGAFAVAFAPERGWLASAGHDGRVLLWDLAGGRCCTVLGPGASRHALAFSGSRLAVGDELSQEGARVRVIDLISGRVVFRAALPADRFAHALDLAPDLLVVAEVHRDLDVRLAAWGLPGGDPCWRVAVEGDLLHAVRIAGEVVESVTDARGDRWIRRRDPRDGAVLGQVAAGSSLMGAMAVDVDRGRVASAGSDGRVSILELPGLAEVGHVEDVEPAMALAWSPDGHHLAIGSARGRVQIVRV